jgi:hypothetical protein
MISVQRFFDGFRKMSVHCGGYGNLRGMTLELFGFTFQLLFFRNGN